MSSFYVLYTSMRTNTWRHLEMIYLCSEMSQYLCLLVFSVHSICGTVLGAFPIERDLLEVTGVGPPKTWLPFMENRIQRCVRGHMQFEKAPINLIGFLRCHVLVDIPKHKCYTQIRLCLFIERNIFTLCADCSGMKRKNCNRSQPGIPMRMFISVHKMFAINLTVIEFKVTDNKERETIPRKLQRSKTIFCSFG